MKKLYIITGINRLTNQREPLSRPMQKSRACERLDRELQERKNRRNLPHTRLKVEALKPIQLTINFQEND